MRQSPNEYAYAVANIRAVEKRMLTRGDFAALTAAPTVAAAVKLLRERGYGNESTTEMDEDALLNAQNQKIFSYIKELAADSELLELLIVKNDFHNLKTAIKSRFDETAGHNLYIEPCLVQPDILKSAVSAGDFSALPPFMRKHAVQAFACAAEQNDGQLCDITLDKARLEAEKTMARQSENRFAVELVNLRIAHYDISVALRGCAVGQTTDFALSAMVPCDALDITALAGVSDDMPALLNHLTANGWAGAAAAAQNGLSAFEKYCDDAVMDHIGATRYGIVGIEPLIGYLLANETEQKNVRIILSGKRAGVSMQVITERMRKPYV